MTDRREPRRGDIIPEMVDREWLNPSFYLPKLAPELTEAYKDPNSVFHNWVNETQHMAYIMVRYADSPNPRDSMAIDETTRQFRINPETREPFTLEDLGIDRAKCRGTTVSAMGRYPMVAEVAVALYREFYFMPPAKRA